MKTNVIVLSALISISTQANTNLLNIYVAPPERTLDWSSPGALYGSVLLSRLWATKRPFGAAGADLECDKIVRSLSLEAESFSVWGPVVFQGNGLGHLYSTHPGRVLSDGDAVKKNGEVIRTPHARFMTFMLNSDQCVRIQKYWEEFKTHSIGKNFGLPHRPLMGEGATDTSLIVSTLDVAGILSPEQKEKWNRLIYLSKHLSGEPLTDKYVSIFELRNGSWGKNSEDSFILHFWDPKLIADWIDQQIATKKQPKKLSDGTKGIAGIEFDFSRLPAPLGTFWEQANDPMYGKKKN